MKRILTLTVILAIVGVSCGDDVAGTTTSTATTTAAPTTTEAPTTTTIAATTTTGSTTTTIVYAVDAGNFFPGVFGASGDPNGSGCVVDGDVLPGGVWFGYATSVASSTITFDLACFFTGAAAVAAAIADGGEAFDFYIRNQNPKTYNVPIGSGADVFITVDGTGGIEMMQVPVGDWPVPGSYTPCPGEFCSVWLYVNGGQATGIVEQYLP